VLVNCVPWSVGRTSFFFQLIPVCSLVSLTCRSPNHVSRLSPILHHIPVELYALTFQHVTSKAALSDLCMVSRHEAQRISYHTVTIRLSTDYNHILSWCHLIIDNPGFAMQVHSLSLPRGFVHRQSFTVALEFKILERQLQQVAKRAL
jgi:hypothetical protein